MKKYSFTLFILAFLFAGCSKEQETTGLGDGTVSFDLAAEKDSIQVPLSIISDTISEIKFRAALSGSTTSSRDHWINFTIDTTKIGRYRLKYGQASLLPVSSYLFYKPQVQLKAGSSVSEAAELNIISQTRLVEYSTYVLPVVIQSVDGQVEGPASTKVMYYVFKTGKPLVISKAGWAIAGVSSIFNAFAAANVIDDNKTGTYWASNITQSMPQWVSINFNRDVTFSALTYSVPPILAYPTQGGYPTSIQIETSMDGANWVSRGVFSGDIANNSQTLNTGLTTARYLRFTSLASVKYASTYSTIFISDISLLP
ncbi:BT_3987 domain-containing protein [Sphingobacterium puteale]|uniref:BT_3987 domain-containing protein n=1 Tax=Sphingobacterium puteale TaxID=2420510 RepID=UPI003D99D99F